MPTCSSCGAAIEWAKTASGRHIPLDRRQVAEGNLTLLDGVARPRSAEDCELMRPARISHFATCPQAGQHRATPPPRAAALKVRITMEFDETSRRAIYHQTGGLQADLLSSRGEVLAWVEKLVDATLQVLVQEYRNHQEGGE